MSLRNRYIFSVVKKPEPPWTLVHCMEEDTSTSLLKFLPKCHGKYGAAVDATLLVAEYLKWNISLVWSNTWGSLINGTWSGAIGEILRSEIDSCVPQISPTYERIQVLDFPGYMFMDQKACFAFCHPENYSTTFQLSKLFQNPLLVAGFVFMCVSGFGFILQIVHMTNKHEKKEALSKTCTVILESAFGFHLRPLAKCRPFSEKILQASFGVFVLLFFNGIIGSQVMSSFIVHNYQPFRSMYELGAKMKAGEITLLAPTPAGFFFKDISYIFEAFRANPNSMIYKTHGHGTESIIENPHIVSHDYKATNKWQLNHYAKTKQISNLQCVFEHMCERLGWPDGFVILKGRGDLYEALARATRHLREFGFVKMIEKWYSMEEQGVESIKRASTVKPNYLKSSMQLFGVGIFCCFIAFVFEICYPKFVDGWCLLHTVNFSELLKLWFGLAKMIENWYSMEERVQRL